ncbi:hypothetical protein SpCBS45565_g03424 [Spizellomyces sp. 'palustris']|nr:hypothetical protein SpCBS45565_g03424 [Spizellomyces sp. 'palustris']
MTTTTTTTRNLYIAFLICDIPLPTIVSQYGDYTQLFTTLLTKAAKTHSPPIDLHIESYNVLEGAYPKDPSVFTGYILTGSKFSAYDTLPWISHLKDFIKTVDAHTNAKVIGICFGHQVIAEALGGRVIKNPAGWEIGWTNVNVNDCGAACLNTTKQSMRIQQMHQDHVTVLPPHFETIMSTPECPIQATISGNRYLTIQGHPEFTPGVVKEIVKARKASGVFSEEVASAVLEKVDNPVDDDWFARKMIGFLWGTVGEE